MRRIRFILCVIVSAGCTTIDTSTTERSVTSSAPTLTLDDPKAPPTIQQLDEQLDTLQAVWAEQQKPVNQLKTIASRMRAIIEIQVSNTAIVDGVENVETHYTVQQISSPRIAKGTVEIQRMITRGGILGDRSQDWSHEAHFVSGHTYMVLIGNEVGPVFRNICAQDVLERNSAGFSSIFGAISDDDYDQILSALGTSYGVSQ